ncbi:MAG TPA: phenylalanine--tRNA ligase subunit beta [Alphaproteobacteria bacterium]|jgi:phenylalanyl-tRNA synthetase beta chain
MKFTLAWLKEHLETDRSLDDLSNGLTSLGIEVEGIEDRAKALAPFIVGHVVSAEQHPNADRLRVCMVDTGAETIQVVCGAPNARKDIKVVLARPGAVIPASGVELKKGTIRNVESQGMMCSARELGLGEDHDGIIELPLDTKVGSPAAAALGLGDPVIDVSVTPNRGDWLGVRGLARELAAGGYGTLKPLKESKLAAGFKSPLGVTLDFAGEAANACPLFAIRVIRGVKNGPSPAWLQDRLRAVGLRPISALVDVTNLFALDLCRPLHVFDAGKLKGDLVVRLSRDGETLAALNGKTYTLADGMTVIADGSGVLSLGGVMGGESTGCTEETTTVVLESALFDPIRTATTGRQLAIDSDARYRFERWVDPASTLPGLDAAAQLIVELCGGEASEPVVAGAAPAPKAAITLRADRVRQLGGIDIAVHDSLRILTALGFGAERSTEGLRCVPPSWRNDVHQEADLVEDVLRVNGYDKITPVPFTLDGALPQPVLSATQRRSRDAKRALAARGLMEAVTFSFADEPHTALFAAQPESLRLANPISADLSVMRPSPLVNLLAGAARNVARGFADHGLFEVGPAYRDDTAAGQMLVASGLRVGDSGPRHWLAKPRGADAFDAKADAMAALAAAGAPVGSLQITADAPAWFHPGRSGTLRLGPKTALAHFGELHPSVARAYDLKGPVVVFEVYLNLIPEAKAKNAGRARPAFAPSPFQAVERDFAFLLDASVSAETLLRAARGADKALIEDVSLFDVYEGKGVEPGKKSVAICVRLQPQTATLTEPEIEAVSQKVVAAVAKATGGSLRS